MEFMRNTQAVGRRALGPRARVAAYAGMIVCGSLAVLSGCGPVANVEPVANATVVKAIREGSGESAAGATTAAAPTGTGWGTLKGVFVLGGAPPAPAFLSTGGKDGAVCDAAPIPDQALVVDPTSKGIANVLVYCRKVSRVHESFAANAADEVVFDQKGCIFLSHVLPLRTSQPMRIKNSDPIGHNTNMSPPREPAFNQSIGAMDSAVYQFKVAQSQPVPVVCNVHPWMKAYVFPRVDPYFAVTDASGAFQIAQLPAGEELEFEVWHEKSGALMAKPEWAKGRFKVTITADQETDLGTVSVPTAALQ